MALAFLETATGAMRRFYTVALRAVAENLSANRAIAAFRAAGDAIRRIDALAVMREVRNVELLGSRLQFLRRELRPDIGKLPVALTKTRRSFGFRVEVTVIDRAADETFKRFVTVSSDTLLSRSEIEEFASKVSEDSAYGEELEAVESKLLSGFKSANL